MEKLGLERGCLHIGVAGGLAITWREELTLPDKGRHMPRMRLSFIEHRTADCNTLRYMLCGRCMIRSFRHRGLKRLFDGGDRSKLPQDMVPKIEVVLAALDVAAQPSDLDRPSFRLHPLTGNRQRQWSITVRANWRIVFEFVDGDVHNVDFVDYH